MARTLIMLAVHGCHPAYASCNQSNSGYAGIAFALGLLAALLIFGGKGKGKK